MADVLVVAAHPDDEVLGLGGTLAGLHAAGVATAVGFLGDGVGSRARGTPDPVLVAARRAAAQRAATVLGCRIAGFGSFPDNAFDTVPLLDLVRHVEAVIEAERPQVVYGHFAGDLNVDHQLAARAVLTACRPRPGSAVREVLAFRVPSSTEWSHPSCGPVFAPDTYVDISGHVDRLLAAYACYEAEVRPDPHARSAEALRLDVQRTGRVVGLAAAEAFVTIRRLRDAGAR